MMERSSVQSKPPGFFLSLVTFFLFSMVGTAGADVTEHLLSRIEELSLGVRSYKANYDLILRVGDEELRMNGVLLYKWPHQIRNEMSVDSPRGLRQVIYWKEGIVWQYLPASKVAFRQQEAKLHQKFPALFASQDLLNLRNPFDLVDTPSIHFLEEVKGEDGKTSYLFEGVPKRAIQAQGALSPKLCRFRIATEDGLLRDFMMYDGSGQEIYTQHFWGIQVNLELLDEEFEFRFPDDIQVIEVTKESEKRLEALAKEGGL